MPIPERLKDPPHSLVAGVPHAGAAGLDREPRAEPKLYEIQLAGWKGPLYTKGRPSLGLDHLWDFPGAFCRSDLRIFRAIGDALEELGLAETTASTWRSLLFAGMSEGPITTFAAPTEVGCSEGQRFTFESIDMPEAWMHANRTDAIVEALTIFGDELARAAMHWQQKRSLIAAMTRVAQIHAIDMPETATREITRQVAEAEKLG